MGNPVKVRAEVSDLQEIDRDVFRVELQVEGRLPRYRSGQFLHLTLDAYDPAGGFWPESRVFSIASPPGGASVAIIYSVKGRYTTRMKEELRPGSKIWLKLPYGDFVVQRLAAASPLIILIAGGTGISPFLPYFFDLLDGNAERGKKVELYWGVKKPSIFDIGTVVGDCAAKGLLSTRLSAEIIEGEACWQGIPVQRGMLDIGVIAKEAGAGMPATWFLSGPPGMIHAFRTHLLGAGVPETYILTDDWE